MSTTGLAENEPTPTAGHNLPDAFDVARDQINDLHAEAINWLDGEEIDNEKSAEAIGKLLKMLRDAGKEAKEWHDTEKAPFLEAGREIDDRYRPLAKTVERATTACKKALAPWLVKKEQEQAAEARKQREIADAKVREAQAARAAAAADDLAAQEKADAATDAAKWAERAAAKAEKATPTTKAGTGRAVGLRTIFRPVLKDPTVAARHFWERERGAMEDFLLSLAKTHIQMGKRDIPGFEVIEDKSAV